MKSVFRFLFFVAVLPSALAENSFELYLDFRGEEYELKAWNKKDLIGVNTKSGKEMGISPSTLRDGLSTLRSNNELPLSTEFAFLLTDYSVAREQSHFKRRGDQPKYFLKPAELMKGPQLGWTPPELEDALLVIGWVMNGKVRKVGLYGEVPIELDGSEREGAPFLWAYEQGKLLPVTTPSPFQDWVFKADSKIADEAKMKDDYGNTLAHFVALSGRDDALTEQFFEYVKVNRENSHGETPLMVAAKTGHRSVCERLIEGKARTSLRGDYAQTALGLAIQNGHSDIVDMLLGASVPEPYYTSEFIHGAISKGYEDIAIRLFDQGNKLELEYSKERLSFVGKIFRNAQPELGFRCIEHFKLKSKKLSTLDYSLFHLAAPYATVEILDRLAELELTPNVVSKEGISPVDIAIAMGNVEAICWFLDSKMGERESAHLIDPILHATQEGQLSSVQCLMDYGYDVNVPMDSGITPLMMAAYLGYRPIVEALIDSGAVWNFEYANSDMMLSKAIALDSPKLVQTLFEQGLSPNALLFDSWNLKDVASFYSCGNLYETLSSVSVESSVLMESVKELDAQPGFEARTEMTYPTELESKYGDIKLNLKVAVDRNGFPRLFDFAEGSPQPLVDHLEKTLMQWKYETPIKNGLPASFIQKLRIPFVAREIEELVYNSRELSILPKVKNQKALDYPGAMLQYRVEGWVVLQWIITASGECKDIRVMEASHPGFIFAGINSIERSKYTPGYKDGVAVNTRVRQRFDFKP